MEPLFWLLIVGIFLAVAMWVVRRFVPMEPAFYGVICAVVLIGYLIYAARSLGLF